MRYRELVEGTPILLMDSISELEVEDVGAIVVAGSHAGQNVVKYILDARPDAAFFNNAGVGKDRAGIVSLDTLNSAGIAAAAVSHMTARIGDGRDTLASGIVSETNQVGIDLGVHPGEALRDSLARVIATLKS